MKQGRKSKAKIEYGTIELPPEFEDSSKYKVRLTAWVDGDVYEELKRRASKGEAGGRYQTLMNELLRRTLFESDPTDAFDPAEFKNMDPETRDRLTSFLDRRIDERIEARMSRAALARRPARKSNRRSSGR